MKGDDVVDLSRLHVSSGWISQLECGEWSLKGEKGKYPI